jgi:hypothetical protein
VAKRFVIGYITGFCRSDPKDKGKKVYAHKSSCAKCYPQCPTCHCNLGSDFCGCIKRDHECECHGKDLDEARIFDCDKCGTKKLKSQFKYLGRSEFRKVLQKGVKSKLKNFKGTMAQEYAYVERLGEEYEAKYDKACMRDGERELLDKMRDYEGKVIRNSMWLHFASTAQQRHFRTADEFFKYAEAFNGYGRPLKEVPFD